MSHIATFVLELITKIIYWFKSHSPKELQKEDKKLEASSSKDLKNKRTYMHILQNYKYRDIISSGTALNQLSKLPKEEDSRNFIIENLQEFIKEEKKEGFSKLNL